MEGDESIEKSVSDKKLPTDGAIPMSTANSAVLPPALPSPPEEFRDPTPSDLCEETNISLSQNRRNKFAETRSSSVLSPGLREEGSELREGSQGRDTTTTDWKMSRSNTISFGDDVGQVETAQQKVQEKLHQLRVRRNVVTPSLTPGTEEIDLGSPPLMEHKSIPARHTPVSLVPGFSCCDWVPQKATLTDERLLQKVAYTQVDTFQSFEDMTRKLVNEIMYHVKTCFLEIGKISFIGHSLGCILIRSAIQKPELANFSGKFHTFLSLSGPHIGTMYNNSGLVNAGMWMMQKWKKSGSLQQLALKDSADIKDLHVQIGGKIEFTHISLRAVGRK